MCFEIWTIEGNMQECQKGDLRLRHSFRNYINSPGGVSSSRCVVNCNQFSS
jgi:hypothetical protein